VLLPVDSMDVHGFVVLGLEGLSAVLARILPALDVPGLHVVGDGLEAGAGLVADGAIRLVGHAVELDELPDVAAVVAAVEVTSMTEVVPFLDKNLGLLLATVEVAAVKFYKEFQNVL